MASSASTTNNMYLEDGGGGGNYFNNFRSRRVEGGGGGGGGTTTTQNSVPTSTTTTTTQPTTFRSNRKLLVVTPRNNNNNNNNTTIKTSLDRRMMVDKEIVDELLLVCGVIGSSTTTTTSTTTANSGGEGNDDFVPVTDCLNWLQDLQRALRRDEDFYRPISLLIGKWKVVEQKLLPLVMTCRYDTSIVLTVVKILVILTKPLADNTRRAGQMVIDNNNKKSKRSSSTASGKEGLDKEMLIWQQQKIRDNALEQSKQLMEYKKLLTFHPSHLKKGRNNDNNTDPRGENKKKEDTGIFSIFVSLLAEPLSKSGASRTDADHLTIELVLHLIRNLLSAEPLLNTSSTTSQQSAQLHQEMITLFEQELVLDIILVVGQEMELRENSQYNLLFMEILYHILKGQDPMAVAKCNDNKNNNPKSGTREATTMVDVVRADHRNHKVTTSSSSTSKLLSKLKMEQSQRRNLVATRHGHFGGTWMQKQSGGVGGGSTTKFVSVVSALRGVVSEPGNNEEVSNKYRVQAKRKNRMAEPFIGFGKTLLAHTRIPMVESTPSSKRAHQTLNVFCHRFLEDCYGPFMKSIKHEFRRDSVRLEDTDKVVFFRLVWFFSQWWRATTSTTCTKSPNNNANDKELAAGNHQKVIGRLIITMDVFTFNLVLNATETFHQHKKYTRLAQTVALYSEMMHLLHHMYTSPDKTEQEMAMGLMDRLFYGPEALDQIPKLISRWSPGMHTREYLCDLVELVHVSLKLLEANKKHGIEYIQQNKQGTAAHNKDVVVSPKIAKMKVTAAEFDIRSYLVRKLMVHHQIMITMYGHLLSQYKINGNVVNHRIMAMFLRLMRVEIATPEIMGDAETPINPLGMKRVTLEPILYNLQLIMIMEQILNDTTIRADKDFDSLLQFSTHFMYQFWSAAHINPMIYVECLFKHTTPHRFCELFMNLYVNDDLRLLAERDLLREEQLQAEEEYYEETGDQVAGRKGRNEVDDDEEELEYLGDGVHGETQEAKDTDRDKEGNGERHEDEPPVEAIGNDNEESKVDEEMTLQAPPMKSGTKRSNEVHTTSLSDNEEDNTETVRSNKRAKSIIEPSEEDDNTEEETSETFRSNKRAKTIIEPSNEDDNSDDDIDFGSSSNDAPNLRKEDGKEVPSQRKLAIEDDDDDE